MKSKVFVSCGQANDEEKRLGRSICDLLIRRGFEAYLAIDVQTILEINERIIRELKNSDCFLFVNLAREPVGSGARCRGSLFSNQELAIAYALGFEKLLVVNHENVLSEGMLRYIGVNTETFRDYSDCIGAVERALDRSGWTPDYSRRLRADNLYLKDEVIRYGNLRGHFVYVDIHNERPDIAALECTARLLQYGRSGQARQPSEIRSPLKATGRPGFSHTIFPKSHEAFDLLCVEPIGIESARDWRVWLNSALDVVPTAPLRITIGTWELQYQFFAIDFPLLTVTIELTIARGQVPTVRILEQGVK